MRIYLKTSSGERMKPLNTMHVTLFCYIVFQKPVTHQSKRYVDLPEDHTVTDFTQPDPKSCGSK
ncbi:hypothetical protein PILCRDRAFT_813971 [Piloderma croceum F 1598]|uniref:Uncharacterized protein n=1 Tax=Piloderma croceum (strain F 1598) TaxID=765440 RepID=A0A0C3BR53_PILCF|nr:hypothetical protein PILCRDRAFT_813971 [Piloderma croceum F 1598]